MLPTVQIPSTFADLVVDVNESELHLSTKIILQQESHSEQSDLPQQPKLTSPEEVSEQQINEWILYAPHWKDT